MFLLGKPGKARTETFLQAQRAAGYSYAQVGLTRHAQTQAQFPAGYAVDRFTFGLGHGEDCFRRSADALKNWKLFDAGWITLQNPEAQMRPGETLVLLIKHLGFYSLIADRVVYVVDEPQQFGFGYGTLTGHAEQGEERFLVRHLPNGDVVFEIFAFARPRHPLARLGQPFVRWLQGQAARAYAGALRRGVKDLQP